MDEMDSMVIRDVSETKCVLRMGCIVDIFLEMRKLYRIYLLYFPNMPTNPKSSIMPVRSSIIVNRHLQDSPSISGDV
jgi:hypothetical protein